MKALLTLVKIGGQVVDDPAALQQFLQDFAAVEGHKILVHGGGKKATALAEAMGLAQNMVQGRRVTDADTLEVVTMVYAGLINKNIVAQWQAMGVACLGLSGADANLVRAQRRPITAAGIDYGFVGDVVAINTEFVAQALVQGLHLVVAPITHDGQGQLLNTNADTMAQSLAVALSKTFQVKLVYGFELPGVLRNINDPQSLVPSIDPAAYAELKAQGIISGGMLPKLDNAFAAIHQGVEAVTIGPAAALHQLLSGNAGTTLYGKTS